MPRKALPSRRNHITQRVRIGGKRILYLSVDNDESPNEIFIRIRGDAGSEKVCLYDVVARLISLALQEGIAIESIAERLLATRMDPSGPVEGDEYVKFCDGTADFIGRYLLIRYCGRNELAHVKKEQA